MDTNGIDKLISLNILIDYLKSKQQPIAKNQTEFFRKVDEIKLIYDKIYPILKDETIELLKLNQHLIKISTFELMEYNFRENTHSNILAYLFNYSLNPEFASNLLLDFIKSIDNDIINNIEDKIKSEKYIIEREYTIEDKKRIDLFILDVENKFVIIIENKVFANIGLIKNKKLENEEVISISQLEFYKDFIDKSYVDFEKLYILLSYRNHNENFHSYHNVNYKQLYNCIVEIDFENNVLDEYKLLLKNIIFTDNNKFDILFYFNNLLYNNSYISNLNELETIKNYIENEK